MHRYFITPEPVIVQIKMLLTWLMRCMKFAFKANEVRFLPLVPPNCAVQFLYDRYNKNVFSVNIENLVEWKTLTQVFYNNDYELSRLTRWSDLKWQYDRILKNGLRPLIVDCGGNIGLATKYFSITFPEAKVYCVEPDAENILKARGNNTNNDVEFVEAAIGCAGSKGRLVDPGLGNWGYRVEYDKEGTVEITTVGKIVRECEVKGFAPFLVKIDIEGYESDLFSSNTEWVDLFPLLVVELHDWMLPGEANSRAFLSVISNLDRDFVFHGENAYSISNAHLRLDG